MGFYDQLQATAVRLIASKGRDMTLKLNATAYDPDTGNATVTPTSIAAKGVVDEYSAFRIDGEIIKRGDKKVLLSPSGVTREPDPTSDILVIGGVDHRIIHVKPISPAGTVVYYEVQARNG